jgi:predicted deacylase
MLKKIKGKAGNIVRGFRGLYDNRKERYFSVPEGLEEVEIGRSIEGREIFAYKFGTKAKLKILFMAGIHGNEIGTVRLMYKLINYLSRNKMNYLGLEIYVLPCINPDGMARGIENPDYFKGGRVGRFNASEVDLNRNWKTKNFASRNHWYFGNRFVPVKCGEKPFSEPESKSLSEFILDREINVIYSFHSRGKEVMGSIDEMAQKLTKDFVDKCGYRYVSEDEWIEMNQTGTIKDWCEEHKISYIEIESASRWSSDWQNQAPAIIGAIKYHYG